MITTISVLDPVARDFAESVAGVAALHTGDDPWRPGSFASDEKPELLARLEALGWNELAVNVELADVVGSAAFELGRALAPLSAIDLLLGGALSVHGLSRYASEGATLAAPRPGRVCLARADELEPVAYGDGIGAARVIRKTELGDADSPATRRDAWAAANVGYLGGVLAHGLDLTIAHTQARVAFGRPLAALDTVQQSLAEVATAADGLRLLSFGHADDAALAWAAVAAADGLARCHQLTGALGFTLEYPLQRALRRARSMRSWIEPIVHGEH